MTCTFHLIAVQVYFLGMPIQLNNDNCKQKFKIKTQVRNDKIKMIFIEWKNIMYCYLSYNSNLFILIHLLSILKHRKLIFQKV